MWFKNSDNRANSLQTMEEEDDRRKKQFEEAVNKQGLKRYTGFH